MRAGRAFLGAACSAALAWVAAAGAPTAWANPLSTPTPPAPTNTPAPASTPTTAPTVGPKATTTTAVQVATNTPTAPPTLTPTVPPPATPTSTFTPAVAATTAVVYGAADLTYTPTPTSTAAPSFTPTSTASPSPLPTATSTSTPTSVPPTSPFSGQVVINEVVSNPKLVDWDGQHVPANAQWLELYNATGSPISLGQWWISTGTGVSNSLPSFRAPLNAGLAIPAGGHVALFAYQYGFELRQTPIRLLDGSGSLVDTVSPPALGTDQAYARMPDGSSNWTITSSPTLNSANVAPPAASGTPDLQATVFAIQTELAAPLPAQPTPPSFDDDLPDAFELDSAYTPKRSRKGQPFQELSIAEVRNLPDDSAVITRGVITMPTGLWDPNRGYIQDGDAGILVHSYNALPLPLGASLTIRGRVHHLHGEVEVAAIKNGEQVGPGGVQPSVRPIDSAAVGPLDDALLVRIAGRVASVERDYATVADDSGSARVYLYGRLNVKASSLKGMQAISVTGVVNTEDGRGVYRLLPRSPADIVTDPAAVAALAAQPRSPAPARASAGGSAQAGAASAGAAASATAFITPVLSSGQSVSAGAAAPPSAASGSVLALDAQPGEGRPWWQWVAAGAGVVLLAGGTAVAVWPRWLAWRTGAEKPDP